MFLSFMIPIYVIFVSIGFYSRARKVFLSIPLFTITILPLILVDFGIALDGYVASILSLCSLLSLSLLFLIFIDDIAPRDGRYFFYFLASQVLFSAINMLIGLILIMVVSIIFLAFLFRVIYHVNKVLGIIVLSFSAIILSISMYYGVFGIVALVPMFAALFYFGVKENENKFVEKKVDKLDVLGRSRRLERVFRFIDMLEYQTKSKMYIVVIDDELYVRVDNIYMKIRRDNDVGVWLILNNVKIASHLVE